MKILAIISVILAIIVYGMIGIRIYNTMRKPKNKG